MISMAHFIFKNKENLQVVRQKGSSHEVDEEPRPLFVNLQDLSFLDQSLPENTVIQAHFTSLPR